MKPGKALTLGVEPLTRAVIVVALCLGAAVVMAKPRYGYGANSPSALVRALTWTNGGWITNHYDSVNSSNGIGLAGTFPARQQFSRQLRVR